ncbi:MAG: DivIVA domain-containing protein [Actinomycetota bacterium]
MARKKDEGSAEAGARLSPVDVQQVQFRRALRGYEEQEVDDFLDRVTEELTRLLDERRALTERAGQLPTIRVQSAGDAASVSRQAEELVAQARERADSVVRDAQQRAAAIVRDAQARAGVSAPAASATGSGPGVAGFVTKEREFLQQLAALVQGHAQTMRDMVATARESGAAAPRGPAPPGGAPTGAAAGSPPGPGTGSPPGAAAGSSPGPGTGSPSSGAAGSPPGPGKGAPPPTGPAASPSSSSTAGTRPAPGSGGPGEGAATRPQERGSTNPGPGDQDSRGGGGLTAQVRVPDLAESAPRVEPILGPAPMSTRIEVAEPPRQPNPAGGTPSPAGGDDASLRELFWGED